MGTSTKIKTFLLLLFICTSVVRAQQEIIGLVTDKEDGMPISGVQIIIKDTIKNTIVKFTQTDGEGRFSIHQDRKDTSHCLLCLSMLGYKPWQYSLKDGKQNFQIKLVPSIIQIKEVTVKAQKNQGSRRYTDIYSICLCRCTGQNHRRCITKDAGHRCISHRKNLIQRSQHQQVLY